MVNNSTYFKESFKSLLKPIPSELKYEGVYHSDLIKNIKEDVAIMVRIESDEKFDTLRRKAVYLSCQGRLGKILGRLLELDK